MKIKKYVIAMAIFGGMLFLAHAANTYNTDAEQTAFIKKKLGRIPSGG